jgi:hypothetical protein
MATVQEEPREYHPRFGCVKIPKWSASRLGGIETVSGGMWKTLEQGGGCRLGLASQNMDGTGELVPQLSSLETPGTSLPLPAAQNIL